MAERWKPNVTVAAIIERDGSYLLVEEETPEGLRLNNPAGHLEPGESLLQGVVREVLEETGRRFEPSALVGVYLSRPSLPQRRRGAEAAQGRDGEDVTYLRFAFSGTVGEAEAGRALDAGIVRTLWLPYNEIRASLSRHRSRMLLRCVDDHREGKRYPLGALITDASVLDPDAQILPIVGASRPIP